MSWEIVKLGELCEVLDSKRKPITKRDRTEGNYPYYGATGIVDYVGDYIFDEKLVLIGEDGAKWNSGEKTAFIADGKYWVNNHAHVIKPIRTLLVDEWLVYYFLFKDLKEFITGLTVPKLNQSQLKNIPIPLPPLITQQKIVEKIDRIFTEIDKATAAAEANVKNVEALFQSYLKQIFDYKCEHWEMVRLGDVLETSAGGTPLKSIKKYYEGGDIPWLMSGEVCSKDIFTSLHKITKLGVDNSSAKLFPTNTTLIAMYGATAGQVGILRFPATTNQAVCGIMPNKNYLPEFLYYYLSFYKKTLLLEVSGVAQPNLSQIKIKNIPLPKISLGIQQKMLAKIDEISAQVSKLNQLWKDKVNNLIFLQQSILKQAFNGELVKAA